MTRNILDEAERRRYAPNLRLQDFDESAQRRLSRGRLLIVGCGALGGTCAMYAAASGVGEITLVDFDTIDLSNLQRQVFFTEAETGESKAESLATSIRSLNSGCKVRVVRSLFSSKNADELVDGSDFVVDAADNPATTYLIERTCDVLSVGYVTAGVGGYHAQIFTHFPGGTHFSDIFPPVAGDASMLPCSIEGVFGPIAGTVACIEASEAIKAIAGLTKESGNLLTLDLRWNTFQSMTV